MKRRPDLARARSRLVDYAIYLVVRLVVCAIQAIPIHWAAAFARGLAWLAYRVNRRHRLVARDNLSHAFPQMREAEIDGMIRAVYRHCCLLAVEMTLLPRKFRRATISRWVRKVPSPGHERVLALVASGRPLILVSGHIGNWEVLSYALGLDGYRGAVIARTLDNPYLDRFVRKFRVRTGQRILSKSGDYAEIQAVLARKEFLGVVGDQDAGPRGMFVEFFGRPASTFKAIALLSLEYQAPVLVMAAARVGDPLHYQLYLGDIILPEEYAGNPDPVRAITQRYTTALEQVVRLHPEQYFWLHRRWKHQPKARKGKNAA